MRFVQAKGLTLEYRNGYNGHFFTSAIKKNEKDKAREEKSRQKKDMPTPRKLSEPEQSYAAPLALSQEKCDDLKVLLKFCEEEGAQEFYVNLLAGNETANDTQGDDDEPNF